MSTFPSGALYSVYLCFRRHDFVTSNLALFERYGYKNLHIYQDGSPLDPDVIRVSQVINTFIHRNPSWSFSKSLTHVGPSNIFNILLADARSSQCKYLEFIEEDIVLSPYSKQVRDSFVENHFLKRLPSNVCSISLAGPSSRASPLPYYSKRFFVWHSIIDIGLFDRWTPLLFLSSVSNLSWFSFFTMSSFDLEILASRLVAPLVYDAQIAAAMHCSSMLQLVYPVSVHNGVHKYSVHYKTLQDRTCLRKPESFHQSLNPSLLPVTSDFPVLINNMPSRSFLSKLILSFKYLILRLMKVVL